MNNTDLQGQIDLWLSQILRFPQDDKASHNNGEPLNIPLQINEAERDVTVNGASRRTPPLFTKEGIRVASRGHSPLQTDEPSKKPETSPTERTRHQPYLTKTIGASPPLVTTTSTGSLGTFPMAFFLATRRRLSNYGRFGRGIGLWLFQHR